VRIRRLRMINFKHFADYEILLEPGLNLVVGPNESGKSTIVEAVGAALFTDPTSKARAAKRLERWGTEGATRLELEFEEGDRRYRLVKDFGAGTVELSDGSGDEVIADRHQVDARVRELVGFRTTDAFESVAAVRQGELGVLEAQNRRGELVPMIERKMTSSSGRLDAASVLDRLDKEIARLRVGRDRPAKNPGPLKRLADEREEIARKIEKVRAAWASVLRTMNELAQEREELDRTRFDLDRVERALDAEEKRGTFSEELTEVSESLAETESKIGRVRKLQSDLAEAWEKVGDTTPDQEKAVIAAKAALDDSDDRVAHFTERAPGWANVNAGEHATAVTAAVALAGVVLVLTPAFFDVASSLRAWLILGGLGALVGAAFLFRRTLRIWAFVADLKSELEERQKRATVLAAAMSKLGASSYDEFERSFEQHDNLRQSVAEWSAILTELANGEEPAGYEQELQGRAASLARRKREIEEELGEVASRPALAPTEIAKLRAERDRLAERAATLAESVSRREWQLGRLEGDEDLPALEARLEGIDGDLELLERRLRVLTLAREGLETALASTKEEAASALEPAVARVLSGVTLGRYSRVSVGRDLGVTVENPDGAPGVAENVGPQDLSAGTVDQLYLAIRFALLEFLSSRGGAPFILDDPLANSDPSRRAAALALLHEISETRQVIMLSCEDHGSEFADAVVSLPAVRSQARAETIRASV
jgi:DNA repair exonuclease SbcCD ATPase subunit